MVVLRKMSEVWMVELEDQRGSSVGGEEMMVRLVLGE